MSSDDSDVCIDHEDSQEEEEKEEEEEIPQCELVPHCPKTTLRWLLQPTTGHRITKEIFCKGLLSAVKYSTNNEYHLWCLMEISLPPLLAPKYHAMNVSQLMKDGADGRYMGVASWFVLWNQVFGLQYLNTVHCKFEEQRKQVLDKVGRKRNLEVIKMEQSIWRKDAVEILLLLGNAHHNSCAPLLEDNAAKASEFLLEPCIIIQLPWNTVLLHQWLAAALVEVLIFEKNSVELRHWPFPREVEPCARELLTLVKQLKERIVLGFAILSQQVTCYPQVEAKHPGWILDDVVLPSLATLQFLISGQADSMLKSIKKIAWSKHELIASRIYIPQKIYFMDEFLADLFYEFFYNYSSLPHNAGSPFPTKENATVEIQNVIKRMNSNKTVPANIPPLLEKGRKNFCSEEYVIFKYIIEMQRLGAYTSADERFDLAIETIKEILVVPGRIPFHVWDTFKHFYNPVSLKKVIEEEFTVSCELADLQLVIILSLMYWEAHGFLIGSEKEDSVMARLVTLGLEVTEQEIVARLANLICSSLPKICPVASQLEEKFTPMSVASMSELLEEVREEQESQDRDWLWYQFADEWGQPVSTEEPALQLDLETAAVVKACEDRIGRIVLNAAQNCFSMYKKGGEIFPHWQTVQYILPCFVASFVEMSNTNRIDNYKISNMLKFLDEILKFYETSYLSWHCNNNPKQLVKSADNISHLAFKEYCLLLEYFADNVNLLQCSNVAVTKSEPAGNEGIFGFPQLKLGMLILPESNHTLVDEESIFFVAMPAYVKTGIEKSLQMMRDFNEISTNAWTPIIRPGPCQTLGEICLADAVLSVLDTLSSIFLLHFSNDVTLPEKTLNEINKRRQVFLTKQNWRLELFKKTNAIEIGEKNDTDAFVKVGRDLLIESYAVLKIVRKWTLPCKPALALEVFPENPPELRLAAKYYIGGEFVSLDKMLPMLCARENDKASGKVPVISPSSSTALQGKLTKKKKSKAGASILKSNPQATVPSKQCRNCPKTETKVEPFVTCDHCIKDKYPVVNYFCSKACKEVWWKEKHFAEHLEFDLGLADFSHLNLN